MVTELRLTNCDPGRFEMNPKSRFLKSNIFALFLPKNGRDVRYPWQTAKSTAKKYTFNEEKSCVNGRQGNPTDHKTSQIRENSTFFNTNGIENPLLLDVFAIGSARKYSNYVFFNSFQNGNHLEYIAY